jgi:uncharacterized membrane protein
MKATGVRRARPPLLTSALIAPCAIGILPFAGSCSPDAPLSEDQLKRALETDCAELTYENFGADFFAQYCLKCHNEQLEGDLARTDAPTDINFNRLDLVRTFKSRIRLRAGVQGDMPPRVAPVERPSEEERIRLIQWIDCGAPADEDLE